MATLDPNSLLEQFNKIKSDNGFAVDSIGDILNSDSSAIQGKIEPEVAVRISAKINKLVQEFKDTPSFSWRTHILDPIAVTIEIVYLIGDFNDRQGIEKLVVAILTDLFDKFNPKIPYVPGFLAGWVHGLIVKNLVPKIVDWVLDLVYGKDED